jgi:FtsP/CotA-like multicopper oxidase with cupredoxin domain
MADSYLGPTLRFRRGQRVRIRFANGLPEPSIVHWHGLDVPEAADGHPHRVVGPGAEYLYEFQVINRAGTYWYHPHPHERTGVQVYRGLAGLVVVSDEEESVLGLPSGDAELFAVLQDRRIDAANQFMYLAGGMMDRMHGFAGDRFLVNGRETPVTNVASRPYRLRLLNGSSSRVYKLAWSDGTPITVLGGQGGLLEHPRRQRYLTLAPAQRADVFIDLSGRAVGSSVVLQSVAYPPADVDRTAGMMGGRAGADVALMSLRVDRRETVSYRLPERLATYDRSWAPDAAAPVRDLPISFQRGQWFLDGRTFDMTATTPAEEVRAGSTHVWEISNLSGMMGLPMAHPLHLHGRQFRVLSRETMPGRPVGSASIREGLVDDGWQDTVLVLPDERVRIQVTFTAYRGLYLYHCHILEHEDMGMMRNFTVIP